jgi:hypothetical protein
MALIRPNNKALSNITTLPSGFTSAGLPSGTVIQVESTIYTDKMLLSNASWTDLMTVTLTPVSTTSTFLLALSVNISTSYFTTAARLLRDGVLIENVNTDTAGNRTRGVVGSNFYKSGDTTGSNDWQHFNLAGEFPDNTNALSTTTPITWKVQVYTYSTGAINRSVENSDSNSRVNASSSFIVKEIAG